MSKLKNKLFLQRILKKLENQNHIIFVQILEKNQKLPEKTINIKNSIVKKYFKTVHNAPTTSPWLTYLISNTVLIYSKTDIELLQNLKELLALKPNILFLGLKYKESFLTYEQFINLIDNFKFINARQFNHQIIYLLNKTNTATINKILHPHILLIRLLKYKSNTI